MQILSSGLMGHIVIMTGQKTFVDIQNLDTAMSVLSLYLHVCRASE